MALVVALWCAGAEAQGRRPVRLIVPAPPGGTLDLTARLIAAPLAERLGEPVLVENRPGAATNLGMEYVARSAPDGRTLLFGASGLAINSLLFKLAFDPLHDLAPVVLVSEELYQLVTPADLPIAHLSELTRVARERQGGLNCAASGGVMTLACEQLRILVGTGAITSIPYAGTGPALNALIGAQVDLMFVPTATPSLPGLVATGKLRALANAGGRNAPSPFPRLPLLADAWPGFMVSGFLGILVPAGTDAQASALLNRELNAVLSSPAVRERMLASWQVPIGGTAERFGELLRTRHTYYQRLIRDAGITIQ